MEQETIIDNLQMEAGQTVISTSLVANFTDGEIISLALISMPVGESDGLPTVHYAKATTMWDWETVSTGIIGGAFAICMARKLKKAMGDTVEECASKRGMTEIVKCLTSKAPHLRGKISRAAFDCGMGLIGGSDP